MCEVDERYQRGQIYTIRNITDDTLIYVGSTISPLPKRFHKHKKDCEYDRIISLYNYIENNDWGNWYIELYENFPCNSKKELERREGQVIREIGTINKCIAGRTRKEHYEDNKDVRLEYQKIYRENNADKIKEKAKEYQKLYLIKGCCDICGAVLIKNNLKRHQQSQKCLQVANKIKTNK